jgi:multiple sugar transport system substrate-binding protein
VWNTAPTFYYEYIKRNQLVDLRDRIKSDLKASDFYTETLPLWEFPRGSGKTYGIPRDFGVGLLFFNKDLLDKAGVAAPTNDWTYEDMLKAALKVNHPSDDPKQAVFGTLASGGRVFLDALIHGNGGEVLNENQTKALYDQPVAVESIKWMVDLVRSHKVAPLPQFFEGLGSPFGTGRVAMVIDGTWAVQGNRKVTAFKFDAVLQPKGKVKRATIGEPDGFVISQQTKDPDSAWELAKFMVLSPAMEAWYLIDPGMIPVTKAMGESPSYRAVKPPDPALYFESYKHLYADYTAGFNEWQTAKDQIMGKAFLGEIPPDEAAKQITKAVNDILDKNK